MSTQTAFTWRSSNRTDVGTVREINEDACLVRSEIGLWVVADGMGGHSAGDLASGSIIDTLASLQPSESLSAFTQDVEQRLESLNTRLRDMASREEVHTIGSTVVALLVFDRYCVCQ